jgi:putative isomerase
MTYLPNVWGDNILFAFSGMDGETSWAHPMVALTRSDPPGLVFPWYDVTLHFPDGTRVRETRLAGNDVLDLDLVDSQGQGIAWRVTYLDRRTLLGETSPALLPVIEGPEDRTMALVTRPHGDGLRFALAHYAGGKDVARQNAWAALNADFEALFASRLSFFERLPPLPEDTSPQMARLYAKACSVLKVNTMTPECKIVHRWTTPDRWPHRHMWLWDSAFHAPAYARLDPAWGHDALLAVLKMQREDGFIAHMMRPMDTSEITQPPVLAWSCWQVYQVTRDQAFLTTTYPALCRYLEWNLRHRDWNRNGLLGWLIESNRQSRSGESGMDNSPRFDGQGAWDHVDFNAYAVSDMRCVARIARELGKEAQAAQWEHRASALAARMNRFLWDEESGFYYDRSVDGEWLRLKSNAGFLPMWAGVASPQQAVRLAEHLADPAEFWVPFPVPTIAADEPAHEADMWRGPTWVNLNGLICLGLERYGYHDLAAEIRDRTLAEVDRWYQALGCLYEYYDCRGQAPPPQLNRKGAPGSAGGAGFGVIADYNWTAAWTALMLWENPLDQVA